MSAAARVSDRTGGGHPVRPGDRGTPSSRSVLRVTRSITGPGGRPRPGVDRRGWATRRASRSVSGTNSVPGAAPAGPTEEGMRAEALRSRGGDVLRATGSSGRTAKSSLRWKVAGPNPEPIGRLRAGTAVPWERPTSPSEQPTGRAAGLDRCEQEEARQLRAEGWVTLVQPTGRTRWASWRITGSSSRNHRDVSPLGEVGMTDTDAGPAPGFPSFQGTRTPRVSGGGRRAPRNDFRS